MLRMWPSWHCPTRFPGTCGHTAGSTGSLYCWLNSHNCNFNIKFSSQEQAPWHGSTWNCSCLILNFQVSGVSSVDLAVPKWRLCCLCPEGEGSDRSGILLLRETDQKVKLEIAVGCRRGSQLLARRGGVWQFLQLIYPLPTLPLPSLSETG